MEVRFDRSEWDPRSLGADVEWTHLGQALLADGGIVVFDQTKREFVWRTYRGGSVSLLYPGESIGRYSPASASWYRADVASCARRRLRRIGAHGAGVTE
jgi:hypothetical protein